MTVEFWFIIGLLLGLVCGLAINEQARQERDERISELEKEIERLKNKEPYGE